MVEAKELRIEIEKIKSKQVSERTQEDHMKLIKSFGGVRNYLLSMEKELEKLLKEKDNEIEILCSAIEERNAELVTINNKINKIRKIFVDEKDKVLGNYIKFKEKVLKEFAISGLGEVKNDM